MGGFVRVAFIVALFSIFAAAPASAGPYMSWGQWTSDPGVAFAQCWNRGGQALGAAGLSATQDGRFFHGSNDAFTASLICYDLGNRFILTIVVAQSGSSSMTTDQVRDVMLGVIFGSGGAAPPPPGVSPGGSGWDATAVSFRGRNGQRFSFFCPANGNLDTIWGTDIYTDDSKICTAAVHSGLISVQAGGTVTIEIRPGESSYTATERYGVTSRTYPGWSGSFVFVR